MKERINVSIIGLEPIVQIGISGLITATWADARVSILKSINGLKSAKEVPDIIILDIISTRGERGLKGVKRLKKEFPCSRVFILSWLEEAFFAMPYLRAGASAYLQKSADISEIIAAITKVLKGERYCSDKLKQMMIDNVGDNQLMATLSPKEILIAKLLSKEISLRHIAAHLSIAPREINALKKKLLPKPYKGASLKGNRINQTLVAKNTSLAS